MSQTPTEADSTLLRTPLYESHVKLGAKIVPFAGWEMPVSYSLGTVGEVKACRSGVGLFDVSHMGEIYLRGDDTLEFLNFATTNDVAKLSHGCAQYSTLLNDDGRVIDDIIVYRKADDKFIVIVNASRQNEDFARFCELTKDYDICVKDTSAKYGLIAIQGPKAIDLVSQLLGDKAVPSQRFMFIESVFEASDVLVSRTGYTGEDGVEILCDAHDTIFIWSELVAAGGIPCGLGARDVLRLEAGYPLYGHELDATHLPFESGVGWVVDMKKGDFAGRNSLKESGKANPEYKLVGLKCVAPPNSIPRQDCVVEAVNAAVIGNITSGTISPTLGCGIALARIKSDFASIGTEVIIDIRGRKVVAKIVKTPFVKTSLSGVGG